LFKIVTKKKIGILKLNKIKKKKRMQKRRGKTNLHCQNQNIRFTTLLKFKLAKGKELNCHHRHPE